VTALPPRSIRLLVAAALLIAAPAARSASLDPLLAGTIRAADEYQKSAPRLVTTEILHQTCFNRPPHGFITVGAAALVSAHFLTHDLVSEYTVGHLKGSPPAELVELRELVSMDGNPIRTSVAARRALSQDVQSGEERVRKQLLEEFTKLGLADVATDYGTILLAFTSKGIASLKITPDGEGFVGTEESVRLSWIQTEGGALEFRGRKVARRPMQGAIWIRKSDGMPLRISATFEHDEPQHRLRDDATVDFVKSMLGFPTPVTVAHRHYVDGQPLTENLYTYEPFHLFTTDTNIRYQTPTGK
jgi:hypothetical protein